MTQIVFVFFLTSPTVNEQYFVWLLMPMILCVAIENQGLKKSLYALTGIVTVFTLANTGPLFLSPLSLDLGPIQNIWSIAPIMVVCALLFAVFSLFTLHKTLKEEHQ